MFNRNFEEAPDMINKYKYKIKHNNINVNVVKKFGKLSHSQPYIDYVNDYIKENHELLGDI